MYFIVLLIVNAHACALSFFALDLGCHVMCTSCCDWPPFVNSDMSLPLENKIK